MIEGSTKNETSAYIDWEDVLSSDKELWEDSKRRAEEGPRVLLPSSIGSHRSVVTLDGLLAVALTLKGAKVEFLLCDGQLPGCEVDIYETNIHDLDKFSQEGNSKSLCKDCFKKGYDTYLGLGLTVHRYSDFLSEEEIKKSKEMAAELKREEIRSYLCDGIRVGEQSYAGVMRFLIKGSVDETPAMDKVLRRYVEGGIRTKWVLDKVLEKNDYTSISFHHGIYVPQGVIGEVARKANVPVVNWSVAYKSQCFIFSHDNHYHLTKLLEPVSKWENIHWTEERANRIKDYLKSRINGSRDWVKYNENPRENKSEVEKELGVDFSKPCVALLTNVTWDAQIVYPSKAFPDMLEWIYETIEYFSTRKELQLIIRVHPAEIRGTMLSRENAKNKIRERFEKIPDNVFIIGPESTISTYMLTDICNATLIYGTKTGVEIAAVGSQVIVAGEAWIKNKGISIDVSTREMYLEELDKLPYLEAMDSKKVERALKYAYDYFFRTIIKINSITPFMDKPGYTVEKLNLKGIEQGSDPGLDAVCRGILEKADFRYDELNDKEET